MTFTRVSLLLYCVVVAFHDKATSLSMISSETFREGSPVTVTCNADAIDVDSRHNKTIAVALVRQTYSSNKENFLDPEEVIFEYSASEYRAGVPDYERMIRQGPCWTINLPRGLERKDDKVFDRHVVSGVLKMRAAYCRDAGRYLCKVMYGVGVNINFAEKVQELKCTHD